MKNIERFYSIERVLSIGNVYVNLSKHLVKRYNIEFILFREKEVDILLLFSEIISNTLEKCELEIKNSMNLGTRP